MAADSVLESSQVLDPSSSRSSHSLGQGPPAIVVLTIENVVSTVNLCCTLDLKAIALHASNVEYNPEKLAAVVMRIKETKTTALIFSSGKMVCTGAKTEQQSRLAARKHARIIQKLDFDVKFKDFKVRNMSAAYDFTFPLDLIRLATSHSKFTMYEPELFPALIYRMKQSKIMVQVYSSGKIVIAGAQNTDDIFKAFKKIYPILVPFKLTSRRVLEDLTDCSDDEEEKLDKLLYFSTICQDEGIVNVSQTIFLFLMNVCNSTVYCKSL